MNRSINVDLVGIGSQFHRATNANTHPVNPNTHHITSTNNLNTLANMTHHTTNANSAGSGKKDDANPGSHQASQNKEAYSPIDRWHNEHPAQEPWNGLSMGSNEERK